MSERKLSQDQAPETTSLTPMRRGQLQRRCACGNASGPKADCAQCGEQQKLQRHSAGPAGALAVPSIVQEVLSSSGQPLDENTRAFMEPRFGHDFGKVRVHTDAQAAESARSINARAFTVGRHVAFGAGEYAPETRAGQQLLAHELTHVIQQSGSGNNPGTVSSMTDSRDKTEVEADRKASEIMNSAPASERAGSRKKKFDPQSGISTLSSSAPMIQRDEHDWFPGTVINNSDKAVMVSKEGKKPYALAAHSTSGSKEDVDHIQDKNGQWYKIGWNTVIVDKNGNVTGYKCKVSNYGQDCPSSGPVLKPGWKQGL